MARKTVEDLIASLSEPVEKPRLSRMKAAERLRCDYQRAMLVHARQKQQVAMRLLALLGPEAYLDDERILRALDTSPLDYEQQGKSIRTRGMMDRLERVAEYLDDMQEPVRKAVAALLARGGGKGFRKVKVYGVGGSATPAGMAREIIENSGCLGFEFDVVRRDSPRFEAVGSDTLLIFASFSGNTEETLNCLRLARRAKAPASRMAAMSSGGKLEEEAQGGRCIPWICIPKRVLQPRESLALQVVAILGLISELKLPGAGRDGQPFRLDKKMLLATGKTLRAMTKRFHCETPFRKNQAKQFA
ncbi:hypothetical protein FJY63_15295, partial [Candidatus Sumerlaeota bacterium]|nr:hypothetical protein [Candidatus Sumerlaeota bacterium]